MTAMAVCLLNAQLYGCGEVTYTNLQSLHEENAWGWTIERVVLSSRSIVIAPVVAHEVLPDLRCIIHLGHADLREPFTPAGPEQQARNQKTQFDKEIHIS